MSQPHSHPKQKFAAFDIDGTIFRSGLYREVIFELMHQGHVPNNFYDSIAELEHDWKTRTDADAFNTFQDALVAAFNIILPEIKVTNFEQAAETVLAAQSGNVYTFTRDLINFLKQHNYFLIAISGSQEELVKPFADLYQFDTWIGQHYDRDDLHFTGQTTITHRDKDKLLEKLILQHNLTINDSIAIGDSSGDSTMLAFVEKPIAFNPESELFYTAQKNHWPIVVERKNMIYQLNYSDHNYHLYQAETPKKINFDYLISK